MGRGDKRTTKGKRTAGSYGKSRPTQKNLKAKKQVENTTTEG